MISPATFATNPPGPVSNWNPSLFLYLGDVYEKGSIAEYANWFGPSGSPGVYYGRLKSITDPTIGNHEYTGGQAPGYFDYWDNVPHYYSFNAGAWHFISLDANSAFGQTAPGTPQYQWLQDDLTTNPQPCTTTPTRGGRRSTGSATPAPPASRSSSRVWADTRTAAGRPPTAGSSPRTTRTSARSGST